ncbi:TonB-dependent receptor [Pseudoxanthomonas broegbernensis]|uniref:TonB-dependent receptor n=1 Tax=Pseudoxanthomonas broegbernensis TaxID=83619 RepID=A0A7V8K5N8_9GAMM|nr:TonB-dependent receptor [Pseudoxanthomonas broegbernensis]KAF1684626.1 TonB-dependent receptor [Pseudoxanthomonas broegbernensis]MBB6064159.1 TonB-dependent receptor [Pseudoxanthomonas broegbernensis]
MSTHHHRSSPVYRASVRTHDRRFKYSALAMGVAMMLAAPAYAQDAGTGDGGVSDLDRIVVHGVRGSLTKAQIIKETSDQIVDSIVAEDIGKLPDNNVAEALQRITGVQITRNKGEGSGIMVRGLTQVRSELNGRDIFTANAGRALSWEDVPAELLGGVDVYKNPNAELIEGGLGGLVNLRTRMPFDQDGMKLSGSFTVNKWDLRDSTQPSASILFSNRWNVGEGEFGILVNVAHQEGQYREDRINFGSYLVDGDVPGYEGQDVVIPSEVGMYSHFGDRERDGQYIALQWKPRDGMELYATALRSDYKFRNREYSVRAGNFNNNTEDLVNWSGNGWGYVSPSIPGYEGFTDPFGFDAKGEFQYGTFNNALVTTTARMDWRNSVTTDIALGGKWQVNDNLHLSTDFQYVDATTEGVNYWVDLLAGQIDESDWRGWAGLYGVPPVRLDFRGKYPSVTVLDQATGQPIPGYMSDINNYSGWMSHLDKRDDNDADQFSWRADLRWDFLDSSFLRDLRVGVRYTDRDAITRSSGWNWQKIPPPGTDDAWGSFAAVPLSQYGDACYRLFPFGDHFRGKSGLPTGYVACDEMVADYENTVRMFGHDPVEYQSATDIRQYEENTYAAYAMLRFGSDGARFPWDANAGVRLVRTETTVDGYELKQDDPTNSVTPVSVKHAYTDVLPSFNFRMFLSPQLQWRVAASRAMSRPNFDLLDPYVFLNNTFFDFNTGGISYANRGNPYLEPMYADQFDTSLEWYFGQGSMLYGTAFYKKVKGFYYYDTVTANYYDSAFSVPLEGGADGETRECVGAECVRPFELQTRANGDSGKIKGLEVGYRQFFTFLPGPLDGLGFEANYTYVDSSAPAPNAMSTDGIELVQLPLEGLSKNSYNVVLMYEKSRVSFRAAYNWRDTWLVTTRPPNAGHVPQYHDETGQLDASLRLDLSKVWSITLDGTNLLNETRFDYYGSTSRPNGWYTNDRRYGLTIRANLDL